MLAFLKNKEDKVITYVTISIIFMLIIFWLLLRSQFSYIKIEDNIKIGNSSNEEVRITQNQKISQTFENNSSSITGVKLFFQVSGENVNDSIMVNIYDVTESKQLSSQIVYLSEISNDEPITIMGVRLFSGLYNHHLRIEIIGQNINSDAYLTTLVNNQIDLPNTSLTVSEKSYSGVLNFEVIQYNRFPFDKYYALFFFSSLVIICSTIFKYKIDKKNKKRNGLDILIHLIFKYQFLLSQLISRDFTTKYRRSLLGVVWSFLNPLLTMTVQYVVFSNIFRSSINNFPVYLLSGIVVFNFFSESSNLALTSITTNSSLITKVYIPKYVFPISRVLSSAINYSLSFIPLTIVVLLTNQNINVNFILLLYSIIFSIILFIGIGFILSTLLVFFRDMQFLWSVILMIWMYATPIFYPSAIIPPQYSLILKLNPIYHIIDFNRVILLQGISPSLESYVIIAFSALSTLVIGMIIFKKSQDKFIFYL